MAFSTGLGVGADSASVGAWLAGVTLKEVAWSALSALSVGAGSAVWSASIIVVIFACVGVKPSLISLGKG